VKGWHFKKKISRSSGPTGTSETWLAPNGREKTVFDIGPEHELYATNGKRAWIRDSNGSVRELAGLELEEAWIEEVTASIFMREPRRAGRVVKVTDTRVKFVLEDNSTSAEVDLDPTTFLPVTMTIKNADRTWTKRYADWRSSGGVKQAFTVITEHPDGQRSESKLTTVETMEPPIGVFAKPESTVADVKWTTPAPVEIALTKNSKGLVTTPVTIGGKPLSFIIDTGFSATTVASEQLDALGLEAIPAAPAIADSQMLAGGRIEKVTYQVGGVTLGPQLVDAGPFAVHGLVPQPDGALGYDFFSRFVAELDVAQNKLRLHEDKGWKPPDGAISIPITLEMGIPQVVATIVLPDGRRVEGRFLVDTGCSCDVRLAAGFDADNKVMAALPDAKPGVSKDGTTGTMATMSLEIGKLKLEKLAAQKLDVSEGMLASHATAGLLGIRIWEKYVVFFDYASKRMYLVTK
jgi:predicted aspartyl protease